MSQPTTASGDRRSDAADRPGRVSTRRWVAAALLASAAAAAAQPLAVDAPTVELVLAGNENQARVVARTMRSGFFVDQLLIPDISYIGRRERAELTLEVQRALAAASPGDPILYRLDSGNFLVARTVVQSPPAILGATEFARGTEKVWSVISVGPTRYEALSQEVDVDTEDLEAICRSKTRLVERQLAEARRRVAALAPEAPVPEVVAAHSELVSALSLDGEMAAAIAEVERLAARLGLETDPASSALDETRHRFLGILELRRGEVENCLHHHGREMCLFPLSEGGRHRVGDGARRALDHFLAYLERRPDDLEVRWLANVAAMTVGAYPQGVPAPLRIGPEVFESAVDPGRFWDVAGPSGLAHSDNAGGSVADDFDGDGLFDLAVSSRDPCEPLRLYLNRGDGSFEEQTAAAGLAGQLGGLNLVQTDYDNDGRIDLYVMRGGWETAIRDSLLQNVRTPDGGVRFEDVTGKAGLGGPGHRTHSAAWADYDGDGHLDLFVGHELSFSRLWRNRGDGTFEDATVAAGMRFRSLTKGAAWGDVDNDGRPDLYVSNFGDRNLLFVNRGDGTFDEVAAERGVSEPAYSFPTWFFDVDNDGWQDLFVATFLSTVDEVAREYLRLPPRGETLRIYMNRGDGTFEDRTDDLDMARMVPTMGANFGDVDHDGYPDLYLGTGAPSYGMLVPNRLLLNRGGRRFVDVTTATGTGHLQKGHGVSFADFDNDGDQDLFANLGGAFPGDKYPSALFENPGQGNRWIGVELVGRQSPRVPIGARIRVVLAGGEERFRWVGSGGSFGASPLAQQIGLGPGALIERIEIDWPARAETDGSIRAPQVVRGVPVDRWISVTEGKPGFDLTPRPRLVLGVPGGGHPAAEKSSAPPG